MQRKLHTHTANHVMTLNIPVAKETMTVAEVQEMIRHHIKSYASIIYVYVVDEASKLIGLLSIRELFEKKEESLIGHVCKKEGLAVAHSRSPQEKVAYLALKHNVKAIPIVDEEGGTLMGVVSPDALLRILYREMQEDQLHMAGIHHKGVHHEQLFDNILRISIWRSLWHRLPWLFLGMGGGLIAAQVIGLFEATLQENVLLAAFIPLVVYMSSAVGLQMESFIIRDLAMDRKLHFRLYFGRQLSIILCMALILGMIGAVLSFVLHGVPRISLVLGVSLFTAILSSLLTGLLIPYTLSRFRMDPANASGPTATMMQDLLTVIIYFTVATVLL